MTKTGRGNWLPGNARRGSLAYSTAAHWAFPRARSWLGESPELAPWGKKIRACWGRCSKKAEPPSRMTIEWIFFPGDTAGERSAGGRIRIRISSLRDRSITVFLFL